MDRHRHEALGPSVLHPEWTEDHGEVIDAGDGHIVRCRPPGEEFRVDAVEGTSRAEVQTDGAAQEPPRVVPIVLLEQDPPAVYLWHVSQRYEDLLSTSTREIGCPKISLFRR